MAELSISFASVLLVIAGLLWWDGTSWGGLIALFLAMWAALFVACGLLALRPPRLLTSLAAVVLGVASVSCSMLWLTGGWWPWGIGCTVGGSLTSILGLRRTRRLLPRQKPHPKSRTKVEFPPRPAPAKSRTKVEFPPRPRQDPHQG